MRTFLLVLVFYSLSASADVVKPHLVEISIFPDKLVEVNIDLSIEGAITGIGTTYKNTTDAPNSDNYDELRALQPEELKKRFDTFQSKYIEGINFTVNGVKQILTFDSVKIDIVGYKKRPRKSTLKYYAELDEWPKTISWQYGEIYGDIALRYRVYKKNEYTWRDWLWLRDGVSSGKITIHDSEPINIQQRFLQFISIGFDHVIPLGWDHLLFIVGMALSTLLWKRLLLLVTTFTFAHTLTLGLAMYGLIIIPANIIEPVIAFSISYVAIENILGNKSIIRKSLIVFLFGLVHGLGFANMLKGFDMGTESFLATLIGFNVGVELAQISIVICVLLSVLTYKKFSPSRYRQLLIIPASVIIAIIGFWWGIERMIG
jgi:hypothetical protein